MPRKDQRKEQNRAAHIESAESFALDYCNTLVRGRNARLGGDEFQPILEWSHILGWAIERPPIANRHRFLELRSVLIDIFDRLSEGEAPNPSQIAFLSEERVRAVAHERLVDDLKGGWRLVDGASDSIERLRHAIVNDAVNLLLYRIKRVKRCAATDCLRFFLDTTKNRSRRWCAMEECGARAKMRRYRAMTGW